MGSPILESKDDLVAVAKKLKKNNVAVDIVNFGEEAENTEKLEAFINSVNNKDNRYESCCTSYIDPVVTWLPSLLDHTFCLTFSWAHQLLVVVSE